MLLQNVSYGIEPLESAAAYEHMLYQIKNNEINFSPVQENYPMTEQVDQSYRILVKSEVSNHFFVIFTCIIFNKYIHIGIVTFGKQI